MRAFGLEKSAFANFVLAVAGKKPGILTQLMYRCRQMLVWAVGWSCLRRAVYYLPNLALVCLFGNSFSAGKVSR